MINYIDFEPWINCFFSVFILTDDHCLKKKKPLGIVLMGCVIIDKFVTKLLGYDNDPKNNQSQPNASQVA